MDSTNEEGVAQMNKLIKLLNEVIVEVDQVIVSHKELIAEANKMLGDDLLE